MSYFLKLNHKYKQKGDKLMRLPKFPKLHLTNPRYWNWLRIFVTGIILIVLLIISYLLLKVEPNISKYNLYQKQFKGLSDSTYLLAKNSEINFNQLYKQIDSINLANQVQDETIRLLDSSVYFMDIKINNNQKANIDGWIGLLTNVIGPLYHFNDEQINYWSKEIKRCPNAYKKLTPLILEKQNIKACDDEVSVDISPPQQNENDSKRIIKINLFESKDPKFYKK